jgi:hypothetical protein
VAPKVRVEFGIEEPPKVRIVCMSETEERRLWDWILSHARYVELLEVALELADEEPAA